MDKQALIRMLLGGPPEGSANAYVQQNWPSDGVGLFSASRPETFYTPDGMTPPPGGRGPTIGETIDGAPTIYQILDSIRKRR